MSLIEVWTAKFIFNGEFSAIKEKSSLMFSERATTFLGEFRSLSNEYYKN